MSTGWLGAMGNQAEIIYQREKKQYNTHHDQENLGKPLITDVHIYVCINSIDCSNSNQFWAEGRPKHVTDLYPTCFAPLE